MNNLIVNPDVIVVVTGLLLAGVVAMAYLAVQVVQGFSSRGPH